MRNQPDSIIDLGLFSLVEQGRQRWLRVFLIAISAAMVILLLHYGLDVELGNAVGGIVVIGYSFKGLYWLLRAAYIRPYDLMFTFGAFTSPILYAAIEDFKFNSQRQLEVTLQDGKTKSVSLAKFADHELSCFIQLVRTVHSIHKTEGYLNISELVSPEITTKRLRLAKITGEDRQAFLALINEASYADNQLCQLESENLTERLYQFGSEVVVHPVFLHLSIFDRDTDEFLGFISLYMDCNGYLTRSVELGIGINAAERGKGYGSEAIAGLVQFLSEHTNIRKVIGQCFADNTACAKAMEASGLTLAGQFQGFWLKQGKWHDGLQYEVLLD